jgi:hypothetical protein
MRVVFAIFLAAHGLVHLLYVGQSLRLFEIQPGLAWPDGAWAFGWLPAPALRMVATAVLAIIGVAFVLSGGALAFKASWWQPVALGAAGVSTLTLFLLWNGRFQRLDAQGLIAVLLNAAIFVLVLGFRWPSIVR